MSAPREDNVTKYQRYLADEARKEKAAVSAPREEDVEATAEHARRWQAGLDTHPEEDVEALTQTERDWLTQKWGHTSDDYINGWDIARKFDALAAEVARLSGERDTALVNESSYFDQLRAAEAVVERLREALRDAEAWIRYEMTVGEADTDEGAVLLDRLAALSAGTEQEEPDAADMADPHWSGGHPHA